MSEIKEGEYIRTIKGNICKVLSIREKHRFVTSSGHPSVTPERYFVDNSKQYSISKPYVKKHSFDIIGLIEVGDYVNGEKVIDIGERGLYLGYTEDDEHYSRIFIDESEIKTIVTREQFSNMEYRV